MMTISHCVHDRREYIILRPIGICSSRLFKPQTEPSEKKEIGLQPVFTITVDDPQKVGDPIRAFTMYTVHTKAWFI